MHEQTIQAVVLGKWADYRPVLPAATVRFLDREPYLDVARHDAGVLAELAVGLVRRLRARVPSSRCSPTSTTSW